MERGDLEIFTELIGQIFHRPITADKKALLRMYTIGHDLTRKGQPYEKLNYYKYMGWVGDKPVCVGSILQLDAEFVAKNINQPPRNQEHKFYGLFGLGTLPEYTKLGYGTKIMIQLVDKAFELGADSIGLHGSKEAYNLYEQLGFECLDQHVTFAKLPVR